MWSNSSSTLGAPLRNRTVDLLPTIDIRPSAAAATTQTEAQLTCGCIASESLRLPRIAWPLSPPFVTTAGYSCGMATRRGRNLLQAPRARQDPERHWHFLGIWSH